MKHIAILLLSLFATLTVPPAVRVSAQSPTADAWTSPVTGKVVTGPFLNWFRDHYGLELLGHPQTHLAWDVADSMPMQRFDRNILEWRDNRAQLRPLVDRWWPGDAPPVAPSAPNDDNYLHIATADGGLGYAVRNVVAQDDQIVPIGFKTFFERCGGIDVLGKPKEEATLRNGRWTQRFQAFLLQYFPENDTDEVDPNSGIALRRWTVQPALISELQTHTILPVLLPPPAAVYSFIDPATGARIDIKTGLTPLTVAIHEALTARLNVLQNDDPSQPTVARATRLLAVECHDALVVLHLTPHFLMSANRQAATDALAAALTPFTGINRVQFMIADKPLAEYWGAQFVNAHTLR